MENFLKIVCKYLENALPILLNVFYSFFRSSSKSTSEIRICFNGIILSFLFHGEEYAMFHKNNKLVLLRETHKTYGWGQLWLTHSTL